MKRNIIALLVLLFSLNTYSQNLNTVIYDELAEQDILIGYCNKKGLSSATFNKWFDKKYENYKVKTEILDQLNTDIVEDIEFKIILGTWCHDSQREVPGFIKIAEHWGLGSLITMIGVDKNKEAGDISISDLGIELVPTFIIYYGGEEIGRIIESPIESLEKDIIKILSFE